MREINKDLKSTFKELQVQVAEIVKEDKENYHSQERSAIVKTIGVLVNEFKDKSSYECDQVKSKVTVSASKPKVNLDPYIGVVL